MRNSIITIDMQGAAFRITQENFNGGDLVNKSTLTTQSRNGTFAHAPQVLSLVSAFIAARPVPHTLIVTAEAEANLAVDDVEEIMRRVGATRKQVTA